MRTAARVVPEWHLGGFGRCRGRAIVVLVPGVLLDARGDLLRAFDDRTPCWRHAGGGTHQVEDGDVVYNHLDELGREGAGDAVDSAGHVGQVDLVVVAVG